MADIATSRRLPAITGTAGDVKSEVCQDRTHDWDLQDRIALQ